MRQRWRERERNGKRLAQSRKEKGVTIEIQEDSQMNYDIQASQQIVGKANIEFERQEDKHRRE